MIIATICGIVVIGLNICIILVLRDVNKTFNKVNCGIDKLMFLLENDKISDSAALNDQR